MSWPLIIALAALIVAAVAYSTARMQAGRVRRAIAAADAARARCDEETAKLRAFRLGGGRP